MVDNIISTRTMTCPDGHKCYNGARCIEEDTVEGSYYCDCDAINGDVVFAGLSCEHNATVFCNINNIVNTNSFCTNGGSCVEFIDVDDGQIQHFGCHCNAGYVGDHCEYIEGQTIPDSAAANKNNNDPVGDILLGSNANGLENSNADGGNSPVFAMLITFVSMLIMTTLVLMIALMLKRKRLVQEYVVQRGMNTEVSEHHLDPDGSSSPTVGTPRVASLTGPSTPSSNASAVPA